MYRVFVVENGVQATEKISTLVNEGFSQDQIYLFAHDENRSEHLTEATNTSEVGFEEQGLLGSIGNMFKKRGDDLRSKFESLGLSHMEAEKYEEELDRGKVVLIGTSH
ncbi:general stress protein [Neobacillus sp. D3-1R]|uniref:general stress protein n=1 Tax=Neobacillus sp. D3-1R TaxID=3445778 RepID=UPI003FA0E363